MKDPIAEYDAYESAGAAKKKLAIKALRKLLKLTQKTLLRLEEKKSTAAASPKKPTGKKRTLAHIAAMADGRRRAAARLKAGD